MTLVSKSFSEIVTFSRSSNATRVGPTGVLEYAPHNLMLQSQTFDNASWTKANVTATANAIAAPDGTVTGDKLIEDSSAGYHQTYQTASVTSGVVYTFSVYAKAAERTKLSVFVQVTGATSVTFDLSDGSYVIDSGSVTATITSVGNGWYRCSATATASATGTGYFNVALNNGSTPSYTGDGTSGIYLWGAQLAVGPYALDYTPTTSAAVYGPRFDYDGSGVTIVEPVSTNLLTYSEQFDNAAWTKYEGSVVANSIAAPNGTVTADTYIPSTNNTNHHLYSSATINTNTVYTFSCYAKAAGYIYFDLGLIYNSGVYSGAQFNLSNGTVVRSGAGSGETISNPTISSVGNGWYRCSVTVSTTTAGLVASCQPSNVEWTSGPFHDQFFAGNGTSGAYLWGAQLEVGSTATAYMVSGASNGFRAVPVVSGSATPKGLLVEEQRQNLLTYSEQFDNAAWTKSNTTVSANATTSPDGTVNADLLTATSNSEDIYVFLSKSASAITYTLSVFVKNNVNANTVILYLSDNSTGQATGYFDLSAVTATTTSGTWSGVSASISSVGSGWFRCTLTATSPATSGLLPGFNWGSSGAAAYFWGAQLEAGSFATSYIPTLASAVTRSADVASVDTLSPWYSSSESTLFAEFDITGAGSPQTIASLQASAAADGLLLYKASSGLNMQAYVDASSANLGAVSLNTAAKVALAYNGSANGAVLNGGSVSSVGTTVSAAATKLSIGASFNGTSNKLNGHIRRIAYYPRRLTNAELQALSA